MGVGASVAPIYDVMCISTVGQLDQGLLIPAHTDAQNFSLCTINQRLFPGEGRCQEQTPLTASGKGSMQLWRCTP